MTYCDICYSCPIDGWICDTCEQYYCEDCSYTYGLYYQFQGSRCYQCADQDRLKKLTKEEKRNKIVTLIEKMYICDNE